MRRSFLLALALFIPACFGGTDPNLTEAGEGLPEVSVEFPPTVEAGTEEVATVVITNRGPGDLRVTQVSFAVLGASDVPDALIGFGARRKNPSIARIDPEPQSVSPDGVVYNFEGIAEGETKTIEFTLRTPARPGSYANSVTVADGTDLERSRGVPLRTRVEE
jgi:hypothetical protein